MFNLAGRGDDDKAPIAAEWMNRRGASLAQGPAPRRGQRAYLAARFRHPAFAVFRQVWTRPALLRCDCLPSLETVSGNREDATVPPVLIIEYRA